MGSHFWPVYVLHHYGLPHGIIRAWNPGNLGGEPLLVHYFPLPFVLMAALGYLIPLGMAFNIGSILPVITLPLAVWTCVRLQGARFPAAILAAAFSLTSLYNEGHVMWGGNTLSTLAGQFAHMYAMNFALLGFGALAFEMREKKFPWLSGLLFAATALSHAYLMIGIPALALALIFFGTTGTWHERFKIALLSGAIALLTSMWFLVPMYLNAPWTSPHTFDWAFTSWIDEILPHIFEPAIAALILGLLVLLFRRISTSIIVDWKHAIIWILAGLAYCGFFYVFRAIEQVDVRAVPQIQLFWTMAAGVLMASALRYFPLRTTVCATILSVAGLIWWTSSHVVKFPDWLAWNDSGWSTKTNYNEMIQLSESVRGTLDDPRIVFEHNIVVNNVGTERVFEMLPYFAGRATTESVYLQANVLSPAMFYLEAEISEKPSCPYTKWGCTAINIAGSKYHLDLLGIGNLIVSSPIAKEQAHATDFLRLHGVFGPWQVYATKEQPKMVTTFTVVPEIMDFKGWRDRSWSWFREYNPAKPFLVTAEPGHALPNDDQWLTQGRTCHPSVTTHFDGLVLTTDCPNVAHYLKFAYNPAFRATSKEDLFIVSPGYIGLVPTTTKTEIKFGASPLWLILNILSASTFFLALIVGFSQTQIFLSHQTLPHIDIIPVQSGIGGWFIRQHRIIASLALGIVVTVYILISVATHSPFFWHWRRLNFEGFIVTSSQQGFGSLKKDVEIDDGPLMVAGQIYPSGLGTHAYSRIDLEFTGKPHQFSGACGYPDVVTGGQIKCTISDGDKILFVSDPLSEHFRIQPFSVPLDGQRNLTLTVESLKDTIDSAHAVWVNLAVQP